MRATHFSMLEVDRKTSLPNLRSTKGGFGFEGTTPKYWDGTAWSAFGGGSGGVTNWNQLYDNSKTWTIDDDSMRIILSHNTNDAITFRGLSGRTGSLVQFDHGGTGPDIRGTDNNWQISKAGALQIKTIAHPDTNEDLEIDANGTGDVVIGDNSTGDIKLEEDTLLKAGKTLTIAGTAGQTRLAMTLGNIVLSNGTVAITRTAAETSLAITNNSITSQNLINVVSTSLTTGNGLLITANAVTEGNMISLVSETNMTSGKFINCNDGSVRFRVGKDGATLINSGVNSTKALEVKGIQTSENLAAFETSGVTASEKALVYIKSTGNSASGSNQLRIEPTGTPVEGSIGIEFAGAAKVMRAMKLASGAVANSVVEIIGGGALDAEKAILEVVSSGALKDGAHTLSVTTGGTPASGAVYALFDFSGITDTHENVGVHIDASDKKVQALKIEAAPEAGSAVLVESGAALADGKATMELVADADAGHANSAVLRVHQDHATGVSEVVRLLQDDDDKPFFGLYATAGAGNAVEAVGSKSLTTTAFIMVNVNGDVRYIPVGTIAA